MSCCVETTPSSGEYQKRNTLGEIVSEDVEKQILIQRCDSEERSHNAANLDVKPKVGEHVRIIYNGGKGTCRVIDKDKEKGVER